MKKNNIYFTADNILEFEALLCSHLSNFLAFSGHTIYFPENETRDIEYIPSERLLFLPLILEDQYLGRLRLDGVKSREVKKLLPLFTQITHLILSLLKNEHEKKHESSTGLNSEEFLSAFMEARAKEIREFVANPSEASHPYYKICMGMIIMQWHDAQTIAREFDYDLCDYIFRIMATRLKEVLPSNALAAPLGMFEGKYEYGILFPSIGRGACHKLATTILRELENLKFRDKFSQKKIHPGLIAGHAFYPSDMAGEELRLPISEQFRRLKNRARIAGSIAKNSGHIRIMPFAKILQRGGRITGNLKNGKFRINLGSECNAREGMRFLLRDAETNLIKGQINLESVSEKLSIGEIIFLEDSGELPLPGDKLILMETPERNIFDIPLENFEKENKEEFENLKFWTHKSFKEDFQKITADLKKFVLSIARNIVHNSKNLNLFLEELDKLIVNSQNKLLTPALAGRYGKNSFLFLHPGINAIEASKFASQIIKVAEKYNIILACGLFEWPFINYTKAESEACALKALEYARLLPEPHIGVFDSLALTISADRLASIGDKYGAMEEYKRAILVDSCNVLAINSLGVCLADLGKYEDAKRLYLTALELGSDESLKSKICYNLGTIFQKQEDYKNARKFFRQCLNHDPVHFYAGLRLGRLYEMGGHKASARKLYKNAIEVAGEDVARLNIAERHLARLDLKENKKSREMLHNILLRNPNDSVALKLLAQSYLLYDNDAPTAEIFARKSVNIHDNSETWLLLARALEEQGKVLEAEKARIRAGK